MSKVCQLRAPENGRDWDTYHRIRRTVLFENRAHHGAYDPNHPDERQPTNHPFLLWSGDIAIGTVRVDLLATRCAALRMVAIEPAYQHQGYGRQLLTLAETFARRNACTCIVLNAAPDAVGFYTRAGYIAASWDDPSPPAAAIVQMTKDCEQSGV